MGVFFAKYANKVWTHFTSRQQTMSDIFSNLPKSKLDLVSQVYNLKVVKLYKFKIQFQGQTVTSNDKNRKKLMTFYPSGELKRDILSPDMQIIFDL